MVLITLAAAVTLLAWWLSFNGRSRTVLPRTVLTIRRRPIVTKRIILLLFAGNKLSYSFGDRRKLFDRRRAKIEELQDQASRVGRETKVRLETRIDELRADYNARIEKLRQARGAVELIIASIALEAGLFRHPDPTVANLFSALVITAVVTTLVMPFGLRVILKGKRYSE